MDVTALQAHGIADGGSDIDPFGFSEFNLTPDPTQMFNASVSPDTRGASRSSRTWVEMRWTPIAQLTSAHEADGEIVQA
ncbi:hypothetical protein [Bradyrhizobium sp. USDA 4451]